MVLHSESTAHYFPTHSLSNYFLLSAYFPAVSCYRRIHLTTSEYGTPDQSQEQLSLYPCDTSKLVQQCRNILNSHLNQFSQSIETSLAIPARIIWYPSYQGCLFAITAIQIRGSSECYVTGIVYCIL